MYTTYDYNRSNFPSSVGNTPQNSPKLEPLPYSSSKGRDFDDALVKIAFSDEEEEDKEDSGACTAWYLMELKFGKYIGEDLSTMISSRKKRNYLRWVKKTTWLHKWQKKFITEALDYYRNKKNRENRIKSIKK